MIFNSEQTDKIKESLIQLFDRLMNPNFDNWFIGVLLITGISLLSYQKLLDGLVSFEITRPDLIMKISLSQSSDVSAFIFGGGLILIAVFLFYKTRAPIKDGKVLFRNLKQAAIQIRKYIDDNRRIFINCGPNSSIASGDDVMMEMGMWEDSKQTIIRPNNAEIKSILTDIQKMTQEERFVINKMLNHIDAFDAHCKNPYLDYSDNQFPLDFSNLIYKYCGQISRRKSRINEYSSWLKIKVAEQIISIDSIIFFGSALYGEETVDVDCLIKSNANSVNIVESEAAKWILIENSFKENFNIKLHLTIFSKISTIDETAYNDFLTKLPEHRKV